MSDEDKKFDREKHTLKATRDFQSPIATKTKGDVFTKAEVDGLADEQVDHLVDLAQVCEIVPIAEAGKAETGEGEAAKGGKSK